MTDVDKNNAAAASVTIFLHTSTAARQRETEQTVQRNIIPKLGNERINQPWHLTIFILISEDFSLIGFICQRLGGHFAAVARRLLLSDQSLAGYSVLGGADRFPSSWNTDPELVDCQALYGPHNDGFCCQPVCVFVSEPASHPLLLRGRQCHVTHHAFTPRGVICLL